MTSRRSHESTGALSHDDRIVAAAIASLPGIGPHRLRLLVGGLGAQRAWRVLRGEESAPDHVAAMLRHDGLDRALRRTATTQLLEQTAQALHDGNIRVLLATDAEFPPSMRGDFAAPAVLFARGDVSVFGRRRVGVIGTRAASAAGRHFARRLGRDLAGNDVAVVSGLARGIDAAAHRGAFDALDETVSTAPTVSTATPAPPIAVVASGLDVVYPREHASLWQRVAECGVIISESPPGCAPDAFRFPLRNRLLAMVSELLVVVESRATGGSMITVDEAAKRGITVLAVPGSPHSDASVGTNALIAQGATSVCDASDVLIALGLERPRVRLNDRRILTAIAAHCGVAPERHGQPCGARAPADAGRRDLRREGRADRPRRVGWRRRQGRRAR